MGRSLWLSVESPFPSSHEFGSFEISQNNHQNHIALFPDPLFINQQLNVWGFGLFVWSAFGILYYILVCPLCNITGSLCKTL